MSGRYRDIIRRLSIVVVCLMALLLARPHLRARANEDAWSDAGASASLPGAQAPASAPPPEVPEENPYDPTQCTYRAWELAAQAGHKLPQFGDAYAWREGAIADGYTVVDTLSDKCVNSVAIWDSYVGGTFDAGHVGWVVEVKGDQFRVLERNWVWGADSERWIQWEEGISFITFPDPPKETRKEEAAVPAPEPEDTRALSRVERLKLEPPAPLEIVVGRPWAGGLAGSAGFPRLGRVELLPGGRYAYDPSGPLARPERQTETELRSGSYFAGLTG